MGVNRRGRFRGTASQNRRIVTDMMYDNARAADSANTSSAVTQYIEQPTKKQIEAQELGLLGYSLKYGDVMLVLDIEDILPELIMAEHNLITNGVFDNINIDKLGIIYSPKKKMYYYLALCDNYQCHIIFKSQNVHDLPNIGNLNMDILPLNTHIVENANRLMNSVYTTVSDLTYNPIIFYTTNELFRK